MRRIIELNDDNAKVFALAFDNYVMNYEFDKKWVILVCEVMEDLRYTYTAFSIHYTLYIEWGRLKYTNFSHFTIGEYVCVVCKTTV